MLGVERLVDSASGFSSTAIFSTGSDLGVSSLDVEIDCPEPAVSATVSSADFCSKVLLLVLPSSSSAATTGVSCLSTLDFV